MESHNSLGRRQLNVAISLFEASLCDLAGASAYPRSEYRRDLLEMRRRAACEGIGFFTKTLPRLGKAIDIALSQGSKLHPTGFGLLGQLPKFLRTLFVRIFDADGWERSDACPDAVRSLRQLTLAFYKLELPSTEKQNNEVITQFIATDNSLTTCYSGNRVRRKSENFLGPNRLSIYPPRSGSGDQDHAQEWIANFARRLVRRVLAGTSPYGDGFRPRNGPGAVSTGERGYQKWRFERYYSALHCTFPYDQYFCYNLTHFSDIAHQLQSLPDLGAGTAKVVLVPKDSRGPRLISCEPLEYQWIQQGLMSVLVSTLESHPFTRGHVNFRDQEVNRRLALLGSQGLPWVTLDMKDASDRVSLPLVMALMPEPWAQALMASRTPETKLPDGRLVLMNKFAPMGSAVCFPIEALVFWSLSVAAITYTRPNQSLKTTLSTVFVYGDDIIVRKQDQLAVRQYLELFELKFNEAKCCVAGLFRESCGMDAYKGIDVSPLRIKATWCPSLLGTTYVSWVELHNSFIKRGMFHTADLIAKQIQLVKPTPYSDSSESEAVSLVDPRKTAAQHNRANRIRTRSLKNRGSGPDMVNYNIREAWGWAVRSRVEIHTNQLGWNELQRIAVAKGADRAPRSGSSRREERCETSLQKRINDSLGISAPVTAYQYTLPRQVTLRRGWVSIR